MANYITTFDTHAEYNSATTLNYPNVSVINEDMSVIYANEAPTPVFNGKYKFTLSDSSVVSAECDATSAITSADISAYQNTMVEAEIGDCVTSLEYGAFEYCSGLTSIDIPDSVTSIGHNVFAVCTSLTSVTIPNSVTSIGERVFIRCSNLISIDIPDNVTSIGGGAFLNCSSLTSAIINATTPPTLGSNAFHYTNDCPIYVPSESVEAYKAATNWSTYASRIQAIP